LHNFGAIKNNGTIQKYSMGTQLETLSLAEIAQQERHQSTDDQKPGSMSSSFGSLLHR